MSMLDKEPTNRPTADELVSKCTLGKTKAEAQRQRSSPAPHSVPTIAPKRDAQLVYIPTSTERLVSHPVPPSPPHPPTPPPPPLQLPPALTAHIIRSPSQPDITKVSFHCNLDQYRPHAMSLDSTQSPYTISLESLGFNHSTTPLQFYFLVTRTYTDTSTKYKGEPSPQYRVNHALLSLTAFYHAAPRSRSGYNWRIRYLRRHPTQNIVKVEVSGSWDNFTRRIPAAYLDEVLGYGVVCDEIDPSLKPQQYEFMWYITEENRRINPAYPVRREESGTPRSTPSVDLRSSQSMGNDLFNTLP